MKRRPWLPAVALTAVVGWSGALAAGVRVNWTASLPVGLWLLSDASAPQRGQAAEFCLPPEPARLAVERHYIGAGNCPDGTMVLLKPVAALPGDTVEITDTSVKVNGRFVVPAGQTRDSQGRPLQPMATGLYRVAPGEVWMLSDYAAASFDGRYFGPIPAASLRRQARPLLTF